MADQAERVILEAEDMVTPVVAQANAGLDNFEKKAESAHGKVIRITDQTRTSIQRLIASLEKQAEVYGKSGVDRLISQRDQLLQRYAKEPQAIDAITKSYERMIAEQKKMDSEAKFEAFGGKVKQFIQAPLQGGPGREWVKWSPAWEPWAWRLVLARPRWAPLQWPDSLPPRAWANTAWRSRMWNCGPGCPRRRWAVRVRGAHGRPGRVDLRAHDARLSQAADEQSKEGAKARATLQGWALTSAASQARLGQRRM